MTAPEGLDRSRPAFALGLLAVAAAGCGAEPSAAVVVGATEVGLVPNAGDVTGRDGGASGMAWGRSVWVFGDTVMTATDVSGTNWHSNSASSTADLDASDGIGGFTELHDPAGALAYFVPETDDEAAFNLDHRGETCAVEPCGERWALWPGAPIFDAARGRAIVFYGLVFIGEEELPGGQSIGLWTAPDQPVERPILRPGAEHPTVLFPEGELPFGAGAAVEGDDLFAFACPKDFLAYPCKLGRVPLGSVEDPAAWRYWDGDAWGTDPSRAATLFDGWVTMSVFRDEHVGAWVAIYSRVFSDEIVSRTAPALTGPWSDERLLFTADRKGGDGWTYDAVVHTEYGTDDVLWVTYTRPNGNGWFGSETALWRVELE